MTNKEDNNVCTQTELEFYKAFGIEDRPEITDRRLLELICLYNIFVTMNFYSITVNQLNMEVLEMLMKEYNKTRKQALYHAVRKIMGVE